MKQRLVGKALELGFGLCRVTRPDPASPAPARLAAWLEAGYAGDMDWMGATAARRADPLVLWPDTVSILMLGMNYAPPGDALATLALPLAGNISVYARHRDYHDVVKGRLKLLGQWLVAQAGERAQIKVFVDTAPVMEKPLAAAAGLGWQGKHTNLVSRSHGSWLFLGSIFTTLALEADEPEADHCGTCRACLDICPTNAFPAPYQLDARRCISYLTIEHKGHIDRQFRAAIGNRIYGCDDCLAVCPWNKFAQDAHEIKLQARADMLAPALAELAGLDEAGFRAHFSGSPVKRIGHARFLRNVLIAIGNSGNRFLAAHAAARLAHESPLVRAMAVWALGRLLARDAVLELAAAHASGETDAEVLEEWNGVVEPVQ